MEPWQERRAQLAKEAAWYATLSGANGWCTDEGERRTDWEGLHPVMNRFAEDRPAVFEYSRLDALAVARSGYLGEYAKAHSNSKSVKKQKEVADFLADPEAAERAGVTVVVDVTERQLGKAEFQARRELGAAALIAAHGLTQDEAKKEWMQLEAERMASEEYGLEVTRDDALEQRRNRVKRIYRNLCNRDRK